MGDKFSMPKAANFCQIHKKQYEGICIEKNCYEFGLICPECNPGACNKTKGHKLISLEQFNTEYFAKLKDSINFSELNKLLKTAKEINLAEFELNLNAYYEWEREVIKEKFDALKVRIKQKLADFKERLLKKISEINSDLVNSQQELDSILSAELPDFNLEETVKYLSDNKNNVGEIEKFLKVIKRFMDNKKLIKNQTDLQNFLYAKYLFENSESFSNAKGLEELRGNINVFLKEFRHMFEINKNRSNIFGECLTRFDSDPNNLVYKSTISNKSQKSYTIDNVFAVYPSKDGKTYVISSCNYSFEIECYDITTGKLEKTLKGHSGRIFMIRYFHKKETGDDFLVSSDEQKTVIVWDLHKFAQLKTFKKCHLNSYIYSALYYYDNAAKKDYIVTSSPDEFLKIWDLNTGMFVRDIGGQKNYTYSINHVFHKKEHYIIDANSVSVRVYYTKSANSLYKEFVEKNYSWHMSAFTERYKGILTLFESDGNGNIRLWNFETGNLMKKITCPNNQLRGMCLWNDKYILVSSSNSCFIVVDLEEGKETKSIKEHFQSLCCLIKTIHPLYGECLLSSSIDGTIKLYITDSANSTKEKGSLTSSLVPFLDEY